MRILPVPDCRDPFRDRPERLLLYPPIISVDKYENAVSPYGIYQMAGNVAEWTADWYVPNYYKKAPDRNPTGPERNSEGVPRRRLGRQRAVGPSCTTERHRAQYENELAWFSLRTGCERSGINSPLNGVFGVFGRGAM